MDDDRICKYCSESFPDLDCDDLYHCFYKNKCVPYNDYCSHFKPIQGDNDESGIERFFRSIKEIFVHG